MIGFILIFTAFVLFPTQPGFMLPLFFLAWLWMQFKSCGGDEWS